VKYLLTLHRFIHQLVSACCDAVESQFKAFVFGHLVSSEMEVVDVPQNKPIISEIKSHYRIGELIRGNCSSQYSRPVTNLTWLINDSPVCVTITNYLTTFLSYPFNETTFPFILFYFLFFCV
jgi:hypothetical protein